VTIRKVEKILHFPLDKSYGGCPLNPPEGKPCTLELVEFNGVDTLFMSLRIGVEPDEARIGMPVRARFMGNCTFRPTDVYYVPE
jgi:uncharacterized OB-fold protein